MSSLNFEKLRIIVQNLHQNIDDYDVFVETGTLVGDTTINLQSIFDEVHTIELSEKYFNISAERFKSLNLKNIKNHLGDSIQVIPQILPSLDSSKKCIFFLDGHWSSGDTAKGDKDCPLIEECLAIDSLYLSNEAIILIDDYRLFNTKINEDWSGITKQSISECFTNFEIVNECIYGDVLSLYIKRI